MVEGELKTCFRATGQVVSLIVGGVATLFTIQKIVDVSFENVMGNRPIISDAIKTFLALSSIIAGAFLVDSMVALNNSAWDHIFSSTSVEISEEHDKLLVGETTAYN